MRLKKNPMFFIFTGLYLLMIFGYFYSEDKPAAKFLLEKNTSLLFLPLIIFTSNRLQKREIHHIVFSFILGCLGATIWALSKAVYLFQSKGENYFFYNDLSNLAGIHSSYFSLFLCFSILFMVLYFIEQSKELSLVKIISIGGICLYFLFFMYLLASRMTFILVFLFSLLFFLYSLYKRGRLLKGIVLVTVTGIILFFSLGSLWNMKMRFYYLKYPESWEWKGAQTKNEWLNRKVHWGCYLESISKVNLLFGSGTGDSWTEVMPCFKRWDYAGYYSKLNAHNQYLEIMLRLGLLGLSLWVSSLLIPLWLSVKNKYSYYAMFLALFSICGFTETLLDRQHGAVFYSFFNAVFYSFYFSGKD